MKAAEAQLIYSLGLYGKEKTYLDKRRWAVRLQAIVSFMTESRLITWVVNMLQFIFSLALLLFGSPLALILAGN